MVVSSVYAVTKNDRILFTVIFRYKESMFTLLRAPFLLALLMLFLMNIFLMTLSRYVCIICSSVLRFIIIADDRNGTY